MRNGTQKELDAAREDATKLPFDAKFVTNDTCEMIVAGLIVFRGAWTNGEEIRDRLGDAESVAFSYEDMSDYEYVKASELKVIV